MGMLLITGTTSGVGLSVARHVSQRMPVLALARDIEKCRRLFAGNDAVTCEQVDLADAARLPEIITRLLARYEPVSHLINNAGMNARAETADLTEARLHEFMQVNAIAPWLITRAVLPGMRERDFGRIINITSGAPLNCFPGYSAYSASKGALNALTVTMAREHQNCNIRINLMSPGPVRSNMAPDAPMDPSVCHPTVDYLLDLPANGPTGRFFWLGYEIPLFPDLAGVHWLEGKADAGIRRVLP
ncbi:MAG: SDR family oxidoreductase [Candidatus Eisenbacteria bacterium]